MTLPSMTKFQIPGLGFAKSDEKLPPLPTNGAFNTSEPWTGQQDADIQNNEPAVEGENFDNSLLVESISGTTQPVVAGDAMAVDEPDAEPSLTEALEAALGGLDVPQQIPPAPLPQLQDQTGVIQPDPPENPEWELDSSPYDSSSESSTDSSSDDNSDNEGYELLGVEETARLLMEAEGGSDDEGDRNGKPSGSSQTRTKNELPEEIIPKPDVTITPEMKIEELGTIEHVVDNVCLIKAFTPGEYQVLDAGSVLCTSERTVIGAVAEVIGKVLQPMYTVHFTSTDDIQELSLQVGTKIFYPVDYAQFVFTEPLKNIKGSDASNLHDEEIAVDEIEFSDDEKEAEYKKAQKQKKKDKWRKNNDVKKEPHPLRQEISADVSLNYDDEDDDGPYKPLARPAGFGDGPISFEQEPSRTGHVRRGDSRGRGRFGKGRGRGGGASRDGYSQPPRGQPQQQQQSQQPQWDTAQLPAPPSVPSFGSQLPAWSQQPQAGAVHHPPPPPGWPGSAQTQGSGQQNQPYINPAFLGALMAHMQQQQQEAGQQQNHWGQQLPPRQ